MIYSRVRDILKYGENPHQEAELHITHEDGWKDCQYLQGGDALGFNNILDADAAWKLMTELRHLNELDTCVIVKHNNPCGAAISSKSNCDAYRKALACDKTSAFGGIVAFSETVEVEEAEEVIKIFTEVVIAPTISAEAMEVFKTKPKIRAIQTNAYYPVNQRKIRSIAGGYLIQDDDSICQEFDIEVMTQLRPTKDQILDMAFAMAVAKHAKSNAIILAKNGATIGIGAGQMSRVDSARIAGEKARQAGLSGVCVAASDAFFPFPDGLEQVIKYGGATAVIQPGGSIRDNEVIKCADGNNISMVFTGARHFNH